MTFLTFLRVVVGVVQVVAGIAMLLIGWWLVRNYRCWSAERQGIAR